MFLFCLFRLLLASSRHAFEETGHASLCLHFYDLTQCFLLLQVLLWHGPILKYEAMASMASEIDGLFLSKHRSIWCWPGWQDPSLEDAHLKLERMRQQLEEWIQMCHFEAVFVGQSHLLLMVIFEILKVEVIVVVFLFGALNRKNSDSWRKRHTGSVEEIMVSR